MLNMGGDLVKDQNKGPLNQVLDRRLVTGKPCLTHHAKHILYHKLL